ncbi:MAG: hypothetical protein E7058_09910 [Lentisphaerae bacterium]|nr:hypothetical protein [Lentisphaerota bacterium]
MNGCPDIIEIIALTEDHDKVSPQVAAHVYCCPECREILEDAIETRDCDWQPTFADLKDAERAAASLFAAGSDIVGEILSFVIGKLNGKAFLSLLTEPLPHLQRRQSESFAGGAGLRRRPAAGIVPEIVFSSVAAAGFQGNFWRARVQLPRMISSSTALDVVVENENGSIDRAVFNFRGVHLPVKNGRTKLAVADFKSCLADTSISVTFADGTISPGEICFQ